jgi:hypothetical protein
VKLQNEGPVRSQDDQDGASGPDPNKKLKERKEEAEIERECQGKL